MKNYKSNRWSRREFLATAAVAATGALLGLRSETDAAEPALDTTRLRLVRTTSICQAPQYVAEELLKGEGFSDLQYVSKSTPGEIGKALASGEADINLHFAGPLILSLDAGDPIVILSGSHVGCFELFGTERVRSIRDLKNKTVAVPGIGSPPYVFLSIMAAYVGLNPAKDINWITRPPVESMRLLAESKIDAYLGFPPEPQELRAKKIGRCTSQQRSRPPMVAIFLLLDCRQPRVCRKISRCNETRYAGDPESEQRLRSGAGAVGENAGGQMVSEDELRLCPSNHQRDTLRRLARLRSGRHGALLCSAPSRGGHDQVESAEDYRTRNRLAVSARVERKN